MANLTLAQRLATETVCEYLTFKKLNTFLDNDNAKNESSKEYIDIWNEVYDAVYAFLGGRNEADNDNERTKAEEVAEKALHDAVKSKG